MSSLVPGSFTASEQTAIQDRIDQDTADLLQLDQAITQTTDFTALLVGLENANQRVQNAAIDDIMAILEQLALDLDVSDPGGAPHTVVYGGDFPSTPYLIPDADADVEDWEMHIPDPPPIGNTTPMSPQPTPPSPYATLVQEFQDFQTARLHEAKGSYVLVTRFGGQVARLQTERSMIEDRNAFYRSIGFTESE